MDCTFLWLRGEEGERWFFNQLKLIKNVTPPPISKTYPPIYATAKNVPPAPTPHQPQKRKKIDKRKYKYKRINAIERNNVTFYS